MTPFVTAHERAAMNAMVGYRPGPHVLAHALLKQPECINLSADNQGVLRRNGFRIYPGGDRNGIRKLQTGSFAEIHVIRLAVESQCRAGFAIDELGAVDGAVVPVSALIVDHVA